jgi:hypothetical protein
VQKERFDCSGAERVSIARARKLLGGEACTLSDQELSAQIRELVALADVAVCAFEEQRNLNRIAGS